MEEGRNRERRQCCTEEGRNRERRQCCKEEGRNRERGSVVGRKAGIGRGGSVKRAGKGEGWQ